MISVVTWRWGAKYTADPVNSLRAQIDRHYSPNARMICVTNDASGIDPRVEIVPDDEDFASLRSPHGGSFPSCYRRLRIWREDAAQWFGERFVCIDLDVVAVADLRPLWHRPEPVVMYRDPLYGHKGQHCGSMVLLTSGAEPHVWHDFDPLRSPALASAAGFKGSDQAWLSLALRGAPTWSTADGVYSYRVDIQRNGNRLPADARLTIWHGGPKPWNEGRALPWVQAACKPLEA